MEITRWAKLNFAVLLIGDNFTKNAVDGAGCAEFTACNSMVGVRYDEFGFIRIDHKKAKKLFADAGKTLHLVKIGDSVSLWFNKAINIYQFIKNISLYSGAMVWEE